MPASAPNPIVFTDLDGTLLDHHTYSHEPAIHALRRLAELGVPVIANTSKTRSEWLHLAEKLGNNEAFVVENGSAIHLPYGETVIFGERREEILGYLDGLRGRFRFESYADWDVADVAAATGLDMDSARRSSEREFSEPLIWKGREEEKRDFVEEIHTAGFATLEGGRFFHVLGRTDKGKAVNWFREKHPESSPVIALGDGPNDIAMLQAADIGIVIAPATGRELRFSSDNRIIRSTLEGPEGWAETMTPLLDEIFKTQHAN